MILFYIFFFFFRRHLRVVSRITEATFNMNGHIPANVVVLPSDLEEASRKETNERLHNLRQRFIHPQERKPCVHFKTHWPKSASKKIDPLTRKSQPTSSDIKSQSKSENILHANVLERIKLAMLDKQGSLNTETICWTEIPKGTKVKPPNTETEIQERVRECFALATSRDFPSELVNILWETEKLRPQVHNLINVNNSHTSIKHPFSFFFPFSSVLL